MKALNAKPSERGKAKYADILLECWLSQLILQKTGKGDRSQLTFNALVPLVLVSTGAD